MGMWVLRRVGEDVSREDARYSGGKEAATREMETVESVLIILLNT